MRLDFVPQIGLCAYVREVEMGGGVEIGKCRVVENFLLLLGVLTYTLKEPAAGAELCNLGTIYHKQPTAGAKL